LREFQDGPQVVAKLNGWSLGRGAGSSRVRNVRRGAQPAELAFRS
jgi:hypothetical protein